MTGPGEDLDRVMAEYLEHYEIHFEPAISVLGEKENLIPIAEKNPYQESYGDGIFVNFCMVRDGQVYQEQVQVKKRLPDKTLAMKWEVFRDKLRPGQKEEWKLTIKTPQGQAAHAEMLATMYDASLDKIWNRRQDFRVYYQQLLPYSDWMDMLEITPTIIGGIVSLSKYLQCCMTDSLCSLI